MLSKLQNMKQSLRDVTLAIGDKTKAAAAQAKARITELQTLPTELPESWEEHIDENGKPYYVDTETGEWYRVKSKQHKRIDTNEKLHIITAESKKEFDEQNEDENSSDSEIHTDVSPVHSPLTNTNANSNSISNSDDEKHPNHDDDDDNDNDDDSKAEVTDIAPDIPVQNGPTIKKQKSNHAKRSSTSVSKGWQCEKCTLENVGHAMQCNACLAPRPDSLDDDEDEMAMNGGLEELVEQDDASDHSGSGGVVGGGNGGSSGDHHQMSTIDAINSAVDASLSAVDGIDVGALSSEHRSKLITFMDFVEAEPKPSLQYLQEANWDIQVAMDTYLRQHPDHPKSRGGSLQFDLQQIQELYDPINFEQDIELPADIANHGAHGAGRRDSTELEEVPHNNDGVRDSDNDNDENDNDNDTDSSKSKEEISYEVHNHNNGVRNEYPVVNGTGANNNYNYDQYGHRRMNTDQQIQIAEQLSVAQSDYDQQLDAYRKEIEALKEEVKQAGEENEILKIENKSLEVEKDRYAMQAREIQNDWDRMSGYMAQILSEVAFIEDQRKKGQEICTPTPKLHNIFEAIQNTIGRNNVNSDDDSEHKLENGKVSDIYSNVADLFTEQEPILPVNKVENKPERKRKLSFGAVNELFTDTSPIGGMGVKTQNKGNNNFLSIADDDEHAKRLSYGGVGLLFDADGQRDKSNEDKHVFSSDEDNPLNVSFKPTYEGIASLFDENNDILGTKSHTFKQPSFAGDIVELFTNPNNEYQQLQEEVDDDVNEEEEESTDSMDKQRIYTYSDSDEEDEEDEEEYKSASDKEKDIVQVKKNEEKKDDKKTSEEQQRQSMHQRFESYGSNLSDPTPISRRGSTKRKHSRGPSFAFKDLFRGDDSDSEDRAPSVQSAPEEHDYYAITAYYGIEEDDDAATGWDSRRSSMFGDYGRVHSRRQSKRVQSQLVGDNIKEMFKVDLTNKLTQHLSTGATDDTDNVADLFSDEKKTKSSKYQNPHATITEEDNEDNITNNAHVVADLFDDNKNMEHKKRDTYTGVKQLFGGDDDDSDDIDDDEFASQRLNAQNNQQKVPRPSTNAALGATFDSISLIKDRVPKKNNEKNINLSVEKKEKEQEREQEKAKVKQIELETQQKQKEKEKKEKEINESRMEEMREEIRAEEKAKLTVIQQQLEDNFENKLEIIRKEIENNTQVRVRSELTESLTQSLSIDLRENLSQELRPEIRSQCRDEMEKEMNDKLQEELNLKLNERFESELENKLNNKITELQQAFDIKMENLRNEMDEREEKYQVEMKIMEQSKCDLIQRTAQEIDHLRLIIKNHFTRRQNINNNNQSVGGVLAGLLNKWV